MHAILIHEGGSEQGHYYSFIYDRKQCQWYRFNDYKVTPEREDRVFEESFGGNNMRSSAYGLLYINKDIMSGMNESTLADVNKQLSSKVPKNFLTAIKTDNFNFTHEVTKSKVDKIVKTIGEKYSKRLEKIN